jgi:hypothetical protein
MIPGEGNVLDIASERAVRGSRDQNRLFEPTGFMLVRS